MKCLWFTLLLLVTMTGVAHAQKPLITAETAVDSSVLDQCFTVVIRV